MIADHQTNKVYLTEGWNDKFQPIFKDLCQILESRNVNVEFLKNTRDIWARDYMPVQISEEKFVEYRYDPDYLLNNLDRQSKTFTSLICEDLNIKTKKIDVFLDGGNIVKSSNCVILTDKIYAENQPQYTQKNLLKEIREKFNLETVIVIPSDPDDPYGHADGMVRFIDEETVLIQGYYNSEYYSEVYKEKLRRAIESAGLKIKYLEFNKKPNDHNWAYLNFLQTKDLIVIPLVGDKVQDNAAVNEIKSIFKSHSDEQFAEILMKDIISDRRIGGGALNCLTWTIKA